MMLQIYVLWVNGVDFAASFLDFADDLDDEEESDDDMLGTAPAFLKSIEELT